MEQSYQLSYQKDGYHNCLICNTDKLPTYTNRANNGESSAISNQLQVIFVLRNILELPRQKLEGYLGKWGSPSEWRIRLCGECRGSVDKARGIYGEILEAARKYKTVKKKIIEVVGRSVSQDGNGGRFGSGGNVAVESREYVLTHQYRQFNDPFVEGNLEVTDDGGPAADKTTKDYNTSVVGNDMEAEYAPLPPSPTELDASSSTPSGEDGGDDDRDISDALPGHWIGDMTDDEDLQDDDDDNSSDLDLTDESLSFNESSCIWGELKEADQEPDPDNVSIDELTRQRRPRHFLRWSDKLEQVAFFNEEGILPPSMEEPMEAEPLLSTTTAPTALENQPSSKSPGDDVGGDLTSTSESPESLPRRYAKNKAPNHDIDISKCCPGVFRCLCKLSFSTLTAIKEHIKYFTETPKFKCDHCPRRFFHLSHVRQHVRNSHKLSFPEGLVGCTECGIVFSNRELHKAHRLSSHVEDKRRSLRHGDHPQNASTSPAGPFKCLCGQEYMTRPYFQAHLRRYKSHHNFRCQICHRVYKTAADLQSHGKNVHKKLAHEKGTHGCGICGEMFGIKNLYLVHMRKVHGKIMWRVRNSKYSPETGQDSGPHGLKIRTEEDPKKAKVFECLCGNSFNSKANFKGHLQKMRQLSRPSVPYKCPHCPVEYLRHDRLGWHMRTAHNVEDFKGIGCKICGTSWPDKRALIQHRMKEHSKESGNKN